MKIYKGTKNSVVLVGGLKEVPAIHESDYGHIATIDLATKWSVKNDAGAYEDITEWHRVVVTNHHAQFIEKYGRNGMRLYIEGRLKTRKVKQEGKADFIVTEIVATEVSAFDIKEKTSEKDVAEAK